MIQMHDTLWMTQPLQNGKGRQSVRTLARCLTGVHVEPTRSVNRMQEEMAAQVSARQHQQWVIPNCCDKTSGIGGEMLRFVAGLDTSTDDEQPRCSSGTAEAYPNKSHAKIVQAFNTGRGHDINDTMSILRRKQCAAAHCSGRSHASWSVSFQCVPPLVEQHERRTPNMHAALWLPGRRRTTTYAPAASCRVWQWYMRTMSSSICPCRTVRASWASGRCQHTLRCSSGCDHALQGPRLLRGHRCFSWMAAGCCIHGDAAPQATWACSAEWPPSASAKRCLQSMAWTRRQ
jgi:hypothetical protein